MHRLFYTCLLLFIFGCAALWAQAPQQPRKRRPPYAAKWEPKAQEVFISYWTLEPGRGTELEIRNNVAQRDLNVTPVLRTAAGAELMLRPVAVPPEHVAMVDLKEAVATNAPELIDREGSFGSVVFRYGANSDTNVFVASMVQRNGTPIGFHFDEEQRDDSHQAGTIESIWWLPRETASDYLILANASTRPLAASVALSDPAGRTFQQSVNLAPAETRRLDLRVLTKAARFAGAQGGVTVSVPSGAGSLIASHVVFDESTGLSATMKTFERDATERPKMHTLRAPMMALATSDPVLLFPSGTKLMPQIFVRNTTGAPMSAALTLDWRAPNQSGSLPLSTIQLAAGGIRLVDLADVKLPPDAYWGTVVINYQGRSGDLVPIATSFDKTGHYGMQTPFSEGVSHLWKGSMWHVDARRNSLITAGNGGSEPTRAAVKLFYNNGKESYTIEKQLAPGEQIWANVGEIVRNQIPDKDGRTIPPDVTMGSYELRDLDHRGIGYLYEGKLVIDKTWGHGYYGCGGCCGYKAAALNPNPSSGMINTYGYDQVDGEDCTNTWYDFTGQSYSWGSSNTAIATLANPQTHFVGVGSTTGYKHVQLEGIHVPCNVYTFQPQSPQNTVKVQITAADIVQNKVTVVLSGPSGTSGNLSVNANGPSSVTIASATVGIGTYTYGFPRRGLPAGEYTSVSATWAVGNGASANSPVSFNVLGLTRFSTYNVLYESTCAAGTPATAYIITGSTGC